MFHTNMIICNLIIYFVEVEHIVIVARFSYTMFIVIIFVCLLFLNCILLSLSFSSIPHVVRLSLAITRNHFQVVVILLYIYYERYK